MSYRRNVNSLVLYSYIRHTLPGRIDSYFA